MTITDRTRRILKMRDAYCWHCGHDDELVIHHRRNRGMGGSRMLDHYTNLILVCSDWNLDMESVHKQATIAKDWGHKLASWDDFSKPVFDNISGFWYRLEDDGTKSLVDPPETMF